MSIDTPSPLGVGRSGDKLVSLKRQRSRLAADGNVPLLGPKATLLHARRKQQGSGTSPSVTSTSEGQRLQSVDGRLCFVVTPTPSGLYVERTQRTAEGANLLQAMLFKDASDFNRWCEADPVRFDHPLLYLRLQRQGDGHFGVN